MCIYLTRLCYILSPALSLNGTRVTAALDDLFVAGSEQNEYNTNARVTHSCFGHNTRLLRVVTETDRFWPTPGLQILPNQSLSRELMSKADEMRMR